MLGNKVLLKWQEPRYALKYIKKNVDWKFWMRRHLISSAKWGVPIFVLCIIADYFRPNFISTYLEFFYIIAFGFGTGFIFSFLGWLVTLSPVEISISEKGITRIGADNSFIIEYKEIKNCSIRDFEIENLKFEILEISFWNGQQGILEIEPNISGETVLQTLQKCGVSVDFRKQPLIRQNTINQIT